MASYLLALPAAALGFGLFQLERKVLRRRRLKKFCALAVSKTLGVEVRGLLGRGREGIVFECASAPGAPPSALKVLFAYPGAEAEEILARIRETSSRLESLRSADRSCWPRVHRTGKLDVPRLGVVPYLEMEKIAGQTIAQSYPAAIPLPRRIEQASRFLACLETLAAAEIHFVHVDPDNVLIDRSGRLVLVDFEGFTLGRLRDSDRWRMYRRLARMLLALLEPPSAGASSQSASPAFADYLRRLRILRATPRGARPSPEAGFESLGDFRAALPGNGAATQPDPGAAPAGLEVE